ncbi:MAG: hypothetical protein GEU95_08410 [Rhizobiales bacterium]|nr:hypothetical protein [Hyphomicrobiales bacterium]
MLAGVAGFIRLVFGLLERPMPGLASMLNSYCRSCAKKKLSGLGLAAEFDRLEFKGGRVKVLEQLLEPGKAAA